MKDISHIFIVDLKILKSLHENLVKYVHYLSRGQSPVDGVS